MRVAIIDLGTNTFNVLICDKKGESQKTIFKNKYTIFIGNESPSFFSFFGCIFNFNVFDKEKFS